MQNDEFPFERLLKAQVKTPSPRFEEALRAIPRERRGLLSNVIVFIRPLAIAATLLLGTVAIVDQLRVHTPVAKEILVQNSIEEDGWLELLTLAEPLQDAALLTEKDYSFPLEYYAFNE